MSFVVHSSLSSLEHTTNMRIIRPASSSSSWPSSLPDIDDYDGHPPAPHEALRMAQLDLHNEVKSDLVQKETHGTTFALSLFTYVCSR